MSDPDEQRLHPIEILYTVLLYLVIPFVILHLTWRGFRNRGYWKRWGERFGFFPEPSLKNPIWLHAVSVGEILAAAPLVRALLDRYPERSLVVTTTTPTGSERVRALFREQVFHVYVPYDMPGAVRRFLDRVRPEISVVMETELWPNLFRACARRGIPLIVANARLSDKSLRGFQHVGILLRRMLDRIDLIAARGPKDAERFMALGAAADRTRVVGNIKFDTELPTEVQGGARELRQQWGANRPVWIAGSTHEDEEARALECHAAIRRRYPDALLILVPRHPERFDRVARLCESRGFETVRRSSGANGSAGTSVLLGDTMGELLLFYAASDVAFVGGSLVPVGGHNMLEPVSLGVPVVVGPYLHNFEEVSEALFEAGAARRVRDPVDLESAISGLLSDPGARATMAENGTRLIEANRGASHRLLDVIDELLVARRRGVVTAPGAAALPES